MFKDSRYLKKQQKEYDLKSKPKIKISDKNVKAYYYEDGSGELEILHKGATIYYRDDALMKHHIVGLQEHINQIEKELMIYKQTLDKLKTIKI